MLRELFDRVAGVLGFKPVEIPYRVELTYEFNKEGLELIKSFEGFYAYAYLCPAGVPTIGYGTTYYPDGQKVRLDDFCNREEATAWLLHDIKKKEDILAPYLRKLGVKLTSNQYSALISLVYNVGEGVVTNSARSMSKAIKSGNYEAMAGAFLLYNKAGGKVLKGLVRRREAERALFLKV